MVSDYVMTTEQLEEQVRTLRKVFDVVRFLDANNLRLVSGNGHEVMCDSGKKIIDVITVFPGKLQNQSRRERSLNM